MLGTTPAPHQPNDCLDRPACQPVCLLHHRNMDRVSFTLISESSTVQGSEPMFLVVYSVFLLVLQLRHGSDEPPCVSCRELVSLFSLNLWMWVHNLNSLRHCHRSYNVTCIEELPRPGFPKTCCTIQDIPLIRSSCVHLIIQVESAPGTLHGSHPISRHGDEDICPVIMYVKVSAADSCCVSVFCSKCGSFPPESCLFSLIGNVGAFMGETHTHTHTERAE